jgi:hypothetical protein
MKRNDRDANDDEQDDPSNSSSPVQSKNLVRDALGVVSITSCILIGSFVTVMSCVAIVDGEEDSFLLFLYAAIGVSLIFAGLFIMHRMTGSDGDAERNNAEVEKDEEW